MVGVSQGAIQKRVEWLRLLARVTPQVKDRPIWSRVKRNSGRGVLEEATESHDHFHVSPGVEWRTPLAVHSSSRSSSLCESAV